MERDRNTKWGRERWNRSGIVMGNAVSKGKQRRRRHRG